MKNKEQKTVVFKFNEKAYEEMLIKLKRRRKLQKYIFIITLFSILFIMAAYAIYRRLFV